MPADTHVDYHKPQNTLDPPHSRPTRSAAREPLIMPSSTLKCNPTSKHELVATFQQLGLSNSAKYVQYTSHIFGCDEPTFDYSEEILEEIVNALNAARTKQGQVYGSKLLQFAHCLIDALVEAQRTIAGLLEGKMASRQERSRRTHGCLTTIGGVKQ